MKIFRFLAAGFCFVLSAVTARADLYEVHLASRTYSEGGRGAIKVVVGSQRQIVNVVAQANSIQAATLTLAYNDVTDALEVVRRVDGSLVSSYMTFTGGETLQTSHGLREYKQAFLTLSGENSVDGSVAGPEHLVYNHADNLSDLNWLATFQYSLAGTNNTSAVIVRGQFVLGRRLRVKTV